MVHVTLLGQDSMMAVMGGGGGGGVGRGNGVHWGNEI